MKRYNSLSLVLSLAVLGVSLGSCAKDEDRVVVSATQGSVLSASASSLALSAEEPASQALTLSWSKPNLGTPLAIPSYALDITNPEGKVYTLLLGAGVSQKVFTHKELNVLLKDELGAVNDVPTVYSFALRSFPYTQGTDVIPSGSASISSEPITLTLTAVNMALKSPDFFLVGDFGNAETWNPGLTLYPLFQATPDAKEYTYTGKFKAGAQFKLVAESNMAWGGDYGKAGAGKLQFPGGGNIDDITTAGYYTLTVNPTALTYSVQPYDASADAIYSQIGVIGSAVGGWEDDKFLLTKTAHDEHLWIGEVTIAEGELKFRANRAWDRNWGGSSFPVAKSDTGDNLKVSAKEAGTYQVVFNDLTGHYHFRKK